jgi:small subunit ribosomal protein S13
MIYLFESELPENKSVYFALRRIYGIGKANSSLICRKVGFSANLKIKKLSKDQTIKLIKTIENLNIELASELKKSESLIAKTLVSIRSYRGLRRKQGLPVRGQRTHTNAKSARKRSSFS